jgi:serine/threonine protein phosphatase 1
MARKAATRHQRLFAIGDIHGCADELAVMLKALAPARGDTIVFVGDYIDRGPDSRGVIEILLELTRTAATPVFLKGNHEDMMLNFMGFPGHYGDAFLFNGGIQTLASYEIFEDALEQIPGLIPSTHLEFLQNLKCCHQQPPYFFVHAGIRPGVALEDQATEDLMWIRHEFIFSPHQADATVVFGHTPLRTVMVDLPYKVGIDTGLVYGGNLSCVELAEGVLYQVGRGDRSVKKAAIALG